MNRQQSFHGILFIETNIQRRLDHIYGHILSCGYIADHFEEFWSFFVMPD